MGTPTTLQFYKIGEQLSLVDLTTVNESSLSKGLLPYCFKRPTLEQSLGLLNGLCKFEDPLFRLQGTLKEWLLKLWVPPKPTVYSPKEWSVTLCLQVAKALLEAPQETLLPTLKESRATTENQHFHHFVWCWEQRQCKPLPWLKALWPADIAWQPWLQTTTRSLDETTLSTLKRFFKAHTLPSTRLEAAIAGKQSVEEALWQALWEQHTLPWLTLFKRIEPTQQRPLLDKFPYLKRLLKAYYAENPSSQPSLLPTQQRGKHQPAIQKIVLVEGQSERCLLPTLGKAYGLCFEENGFWVIASGGKSATLQKCLSLVTWVNIPIAVLLDADAQQEASQLIQLLQQRTEENPPFSVWVLAEGELEDTYPLRWVYAVLEKLEVGQEKDASASAFIAHGLPARIPSFEVFEAFVLDAKAHGERASEAFRRFWLAWGYPTFDKRELAEGIAKVVDTLGIDLLGQNSLRQWFEILSQFQ